MSYLEFYEMNEEPFSNAPVSRFYFNSAPHSKALVRLMYSIDAMKGLAVLMGDIGSGKTTLARRLLDHLNEDEYEAALLVIIHSGVDAKWLLKRIALQLGVTDPPDDRLAVLNLLYKRLLEIHEAGKKAVVLIDEAQMLASREIMEEFRGLLNLELPETKLLNIVFFGLPELEQCLALDPPLEQRIAVKYHLGTLDEEATEAYIKHRLRLAGAKRMLFTREAIEGIHQFSSGVPRVINTICDNALFEGSQLKSPLIDRPMIKNVVTDLGLNKRREGQVISGTRATDFETPSEGPGELAASGRGERRANPPPPTASVTRPTLPPGLSAPTRFWEKNPVSQVTPVSKEEIPAMEEIDGILDGLVGDDS